MKKFFLHPLIVNVLFFLFVIISTPIFSIVSFRVISILPSLKNDDDKILILTFCLIFIYVFCIIFTKFILMFKIKVKKYNLNDYPKFKKIYLLGYIAKIVIIGLFIFLSILSKAMHILKVDMQINQIATICVRVVIIIIFLVLEIFLDKRLKKMKKSNISAV